MSFHGRLLAARKQLGLTQSQVAERIGVAKSTYTGYERGTSEPDMDRIILLMRVLDIDANYLWQDEMREAGVTDTMLSENDLVLIRKYHSLDAHGQSVVTAVLDLEAARCAATERDFDALYARQREEITEMNTDSSTVQNMG